MNKEGGQKKEHLVPRVKFNLSGAEIIGCLRKGHMVRRSAWVDKFYIRICNETGFDEEGNAIQGRSALYTIGTHGYFMHLAHSQQPLKGHRTYYHPVAGYDVSTRDSEGVGMLFENDWEDHGFVSAVDFDSMRESLKDILRESIKEAKRVSIEKAEASDE